MRCALLIAGGEGLPAAQARITYHMGLRLLVDLSHALGVKVDTGRPHAADGGRFADDYRDFRRLGAEVEPHAGRFPRARAACSTV